MSELRTHLPNSIASASSSRLSHEFDLSRDMHDLGRGVDCFPPAHFLHLDHGDEGASTECAGAGNGLSGAVLLLVSLRHASPQVEAHQLDL